MSRIRANQFTDKAGTGAPTFPNGVQVTGVSTLGNTVVGGGTTQLIVTGNARITGILTIGTSSITLDGSSNQVNVGTGVTLHHTNGVQVGGNTLHSTVLTVNQINASGVITATSFSGDGTNLTNTGSTLSAASGSQRVVLTGQTSGTMTASATDSALTFAQSTGTLSATKFSGDGSALTGIGGTTDVRTNSLVVSGITTVAAGSTAAPSITPTGDSNTGIFFPSADTVAIAEGGVEALRVNSSGEVQIANGNLVFSTAGTGIDFSATANSSGTMTSELLNDYETGTWTPTVKGWTGVTYTIRQGVYTKVGNLVTAWVWLQFSGTSTGSHVHISGLPFHVTDGGGTYARGGAPTYYTAPMNETTGVLFYPGGADEIQVYTDNDIGGAVLSNGNASGHYLIGSVQYAHT